MKPKPVVGQKLFALNIGNAARHVPQTLTPVVVCKVGRKYFSVKKEDRGTWEVSFQIDNWCEHAEFSASMALYTSEQEWKDEQEAELILKLIREQFQYCHSGKFNIECLRQIRDLIQPVPQA